MRSALRWVGRVLAWAVILGAACSLIVGVLIPRLAGATPYAILTGSMTPRLPAGTLVVVRPVDPSRIRVGDVITYQIASGDPTVVTHRVVTQGVNVATGQFLFQTRGDANNATDPGWVQPVQIKGELWYSVPWLGWVNRLMTTAQHRWAVVVVAAALFGYAGLMFASAFRERQRRRGARSRPDDASSQAAP